MIRFIRIGPAPEYIIGALFRSFGYFVFPPFSGIRISIASPTVTHKMSAQAVVFSAWR